jgi:hypothetical protein
LLEISDYAYFYIWRYAFYLAGYGPSINLNFLAIASTDQ